MGKADSGIREGKGKGGKRIMPEEQITIGINEIAELIRNKYGYKSVSIERIWTGIRCDDMQYVELGPGSILNVHISVSGKGTKYTIMVITRPAVGLSIEITNPQPAFTKNNITYMSDADYAKEVLAEGDDEMIHQLRGNMKLVSEILKVEPIEGIEAIKKIHEQSAESISAAMDAIKEADWNIEDGMGVIQQYERQKIFEKALHQGLEITKDIRKKEMKKEKKTNTININDKARVNLTAHGQEILRQFYLGSYGYESLISSHYVTGNTYDFQMWELMKIFGKHMDDGMKTIFEKNKINVKG